jgi:hypothetical protein
MAWSDLADWPFWEHVGKVAPIITSLIALVAATVAIVSLRTQVEIARKRAAIDVFLKTEMDQGMLTAYRDFEVGLKASKHKAFDQRVCYGFWYNILKKACTQGAEIISHARKPDDGGHTYDHILMVNERWQRGGNEKWRR